MATRLAGTLTGLWLLIAVGSAWADMEIIPLRHRTVDQVLPVLRPLLEPGGALSGMNDQLVIRASRENIVQLRKVLESIDVAPRRLVISVRQDSGAHHSGAASEGRVEQSIQALEGMPALIQIGQSVPTAGRTVIRGPGGAIVTDSVTYRDAVVGFEVVPRIAGDRVILDVGSRRDAPGAGGSMDVQRLASTVSGRLGVWFELGGASHDESRQSSGPLGGTSALRHDVRRVWIKVEEIR